jgi:hypothetical protein
MISCCMLFISASAFAQSVVKGIVLDSDKIPVAGVTIQAKPGTAKAQTDAEGKYSISVPSGATQLVFSFVGMETQTVSINNQNRDQYHHGVLK